MTIAPEDFDAPESRELRDAAKAEVSERYGRDTESGGPPRAGEVAAFLVARDGRGEAVGCGALRPLEDGAVEIKRMYVRPGARGRGLGRAILAALEAEAARRGHEVVRLETGDLQTEAMALYRAAGYREIPRYGPYAASEISRCFERRLG